MSESKGDLSFEPLLRGSLIGRYQTKWSHNYWIAFGDWLAEPRYSAHYDAASKIVIRQTGDSLVATLDREQFIVRDNLYTIVPREEGIDLRYILGLMNSGFLNWYYQSIINAEKGEALAQVKRGHIAQLPIVVPETRGAAGKARHDRMVGLVERMLDLQKKLPNARTAHDKELIQRRIDATDREIDRLVYDLYGLTEKEIRIVEGGDR